METFSLLLAICAAAQKPVTRNFDIFFDDDCLLSTHGIA